MLSVPIRTFFFIRTAGCTAFCCQEASRWVAAAGDRLLDTRYYSGPAASQSSSERCNEAEVGGPTQHSMCTPPRPLLHTPPHLCPKAEPQRALRARRRRLNLQEAAVTVGRQHRDPHAEKVGGGLRGGHHQPTGQGGEGTARRTAETATTANTHTAPPAATVAKQSLSPPQTVTCSVTWSPQAPGRAMSAQYWRYGPGTYSAYRSGWLHSCWHTDCRTKACRRGDLRPAVRCGSLWCSRSRGAQARGASVQQSSISAPPGSPRPAPPPPIHPALAHRYSWSLSARN